MHPKTQAEEIRQRMNTIANPGVYEDEERGTEYYKAQEKQYTDHVKAELDQVISHLEQAITYRYKNSHLMLNNGNKAGTGELDSLKSKLEELYNGWDESAELYGM